MASRSLRVLVIDDRERDFFITRSLLRKMQSVMTRLQWISDYDRGLEALLKNSFDVCLVDYNLGRRNGLDFLRTAIRKGCTAPIIILSDRRDHVVDIKAMKAGAADYLVKREIGPSLLERSMRYSMEHKREERALRAAKRLQQEAKEKLEKAMQSITEELEMAQKVQESMLPRDTTDINGLSLATAYLPCRRIGGDLYDIIKIDETRTCFVMFDVVGHGVPAALISAMVKVSFSKNITYSLSSSDIMERVNKEIVGFFKEKRHITAFVGIYDHTTKEITFTGGGHPSPIVVRSTPKRIDYLISRGLPLGMFADIKYEVSRSYLHSGDCLVIYTDGLTESNSADGVLFGKKRLENILLSLPQESTANDVLGAVVKAQFMFNGNVERNDDITVVIAKIP